MSDEILDREETRNDHPDHNQIRYAGFGVRLGASLLDSLALFPLVGLNYYNIFHTKSLSFALLLALLSALYKPLMEFYYGATVGKMLLRIRVVNYQLEPISPEQALIRYAPWVLSVGVNMLATMAIFQMEGFAEISDLIKYSEFAVESPYQKWIQFAIWFIPISAFGMFFNPQKQAVHDQLAKTYCIYR
ncbi:MAG: RDD family protein [Saprospiraceae bacterium]|nr:RDD family protein [Saprospiraceae bacterium]